MRFILFGQMGLLQDANRSTAGKRWSVMRNERRALISHASYAKSFILYSHTDGTVNAGSLLHYSSSVSLIIFD